MLLVLLIRSAGGQARLRMLDSKGRWTAVAASGHELGQVGWVRALATDAIGRLYVADGLKSRLQVRDVNGKWYELPAASSSGHSEFSSGFLINVTVDRHDVLYLAADGPLRVLRWTPQPQSNTELR